ncbi:MAG: NAD-dependent epimerase/dehydratase family protein, partial [Myxococcales bacterium]
VIHTAEVGCGIAAHRAHPGLHFHANAAMALNLIEEGRKAGVERFIYVGTADAYPGDAPVPMKESDLWAGLPDASHASYGVAKRIAAIMLEAYRAEYGMGGAYLLMTNIYGPGADFDPESSQVVAAMIRRFVEAERSGAEHATCWGSGQATRDFLYVDDAARAIVAAADAYDSPVPLNIGSGTEVPIRELAELTAAAAGYEGRIVWDTPGPDGIARRSLDVTRAGDLLGFKPEVSLAEGLERTVGWWRERA